MNKSANTSWWQSLPVLLTGITAFVGAVTGLLTVLYQIGAFSVFIPKHKESEVVATVNFPPYEANAINIWIVGSPHTGNIPSSQVPPEIADNARDANFTLDVKTFGAKDFAPAFFAAFAANSGPDVLVIDNYGHIDGITTPLGTFVGLASKPQVRDALVAVSETLRSFGRGWQFLFATSRNNQKAKALAMPAPKCKPEFAESVTRISPEEEGEVRTRAVASGYAYLTCDKDGMTAISDKDRLGTGCINPRNPYFTKNVKACGIFGNQRLNFVSLVASFSTEHAVGQKSVLAAVRKPLDKWRLLAIASDPASIGLLDGPVQRLGTSLGEGGPGNTEAPNAAELITDDWAFPSPAANERFGDFVWKPSTSADVVAEAVEFEYGGDTRIFLSFDVSQSPQKISTGKLWTTKSVWHWRVWSVAKNGNISLSEHRSFKN
jgi:hypothetical protein